MQDFVPNPLLFHARCIAAHPLGLPPKQEALYLITPGEGKAIGRHFASPLLYDQRARDGTSGHCDMLTGSAAGRPAPSISNPALLARSSESTDRSGVWTFALGAAVY